MKKKLILGIVGVVMVASLVGCGSANQDTAADVSIPTEEVVAEVTDNEVSTESTDESVTDEATDNEVADEQTDNEVVDESTEEPPTTPKVVVELGDGTIIEDGTIRYSESETEETETSAESTDFTSTGLAYNTAFKWNSTDGSITYTVLEDGTVAYHTETKSELGVSEWDETYTLKKVLDYGNDFYGIEIQAIFNNESHTFLYKKSNPDNAVWVLGTADTVELANYLYDNTKGDGLNSLDYNGTGKSTQYYTVEK